MLKTIRRITAALFFVLITLLFLDFTGTLHIWFGWMAKVQLIPALLAVNVVIVAILILLTLLFGRVYCSVLCPLGVLQDGISHISGQRKGRRNRFRYSKARPWLRYGMLVLFVVALIAGISVVVSLLDPYAAYGRIAANFLAPVYRLGNNLLAWFAEKADSYAFYETEVWMKSWITFGAVILTLIVVGILAWRNGRTYCNTICPAGTLLGFFSRFSIFRPTFDAEKCTRCGLCERGCKASCIDSKNMIIDQSRCVTCFNCMEKCNFGAMKYAPVRIGGKKVSSNQQGKNEKGVSRRNFLAIVGGFLVTHTVKAQQLQAEGGLAEIEDKKVPDRKTPVLPPGGQGLWHMKVHCTACQLCVSACPNHILYPSASLSTLMQPQMSFEEGYCRPECVECSKVCPTGAIHRITAAEKSAISIGNAIWIRNNCVVLKDELPCKACERNCPTGAITLVAAERDNPKSLEIPVVDNALCIGCGACEYVCPARPFSAIYVEGHVRHHDV